MKRRARRVTFIFLGFVCLLLAISALFTWRIIRQDRLNRALIAAVERGDARIALTVLDQGANPNLRDAPHQRVSPLRLLMDFCRGIKPSTQTSHGVPILLTAFGYKEFGTSSGGGAMWDFRGRPVYPLVKALIDHGADVNMRNAPTLMPPHPGDTALMLAVWYADLPTIRLLLARHADVSLKNWSRDTALSNATGPNFDLFASERIPDASKRAIIQQAIVRLLKAAGAKE
jgi:ankyrin repeat protein